MEAFLILVLIALFYVIMRASTKLRSASEDRAGAISGVGSALTIKRSQPQRLVVKLNKDAVEKGRALLTAGEDFDSVCRAIEPEYANWGALQQQVFQRAMKALLETQLVPGTSSHVT